MKSRIAVAIISLVIVTSLGAQNPVPSAGPRTRAITERDLFDFIWVANPQLSPDGMRVAFTRVNVDEKRTGYETSIWMVSTSGGESPVVARLDRKCLEQKVSCAPRSQAEAFSIRGISPGRHTYALPCVYLYSMVSSTL
jgi:dipeptidyl aminopeptidase/acylaminoacyl peptidase